MALNIRNHCHSLGPALRNSKGFGAFPEALPRLLYEIENIYHRGLLPGGVVCLIDFDGLPSMH